MYYIPKTYALVHVGLYAFPILIYEIGIHWETVHDFYTRTEQLHMHQQNYMYNNTTCTSLKDHK